MSEFGFLVSSQELCILFEKCSELLHRQIGLIRVPVSTCQAKLRVRSGGTPFRRKPYRFRSRFRRFIEAAQIAIRKSFMQEYCTTVRCISGAFAKRFKLRQCFGRAPRLSKRLYLTESIPIGHLVLR